MNFDKLDRIVFNSKDEQRMLKKWSYENSDLLQSYKIVLDEGLFVFPSVYKFYFNVDGDSVDFKLYYYDDDLLCLTFTYHFEGTYSNIWVLDEKSWIKPKEEYMKDVVHMFEGIMAYLTYFSNNRKIVEYSESSRSIFKKGKKGKGKRVVGKVKIGVYKLHVSKASTLEMRREYKRFTDSWTVRGHWRHYKNGKKVWIKSYKKGKGETMPKQYQL